MNLDISKIVNEKISALEENGEIQKKIEEQLEKTINDAITSALSGWDIKRAIEGQLKEGIGGICADCGISAYNGFMAEKVEQIIQEQINTDMAEKVNAALESLMLKKYENVKLSDIFNRYREWVYEHTEESDKYDRQHFHCEFDVDENGNFTHYSCRFADHPLENKSFYREQPEIEVKFCVYKDAPKSTISTLYLDGHKLADCVRIGALTEVESFLVNLYYNKTEIIMDVSDVDDGDYFDIDI